MTYYPDRPGCFVVGIEIMFVGGVLLIFLILAGRLLLGLVPWGFWSGGMW